MDQTINYPCIFKFSRQKENEVYVVKISKSETLPVAVNAVRHTRHSRVRPPDQKSQQLPQGLLPEVAPISNPAPAKNRIVLSKHSFIQFYS